MNLLIIFILVFAVGHEAFHVHGPSAPLVAHVGAPVLLPCFIESPLPLEDLQVEWRKMDSDSLVIVFQQGKNRSDLQSQEFRDRVDFFPDEVSKGNFSILLRNVVEDDAGGYRCQINTNQYSSEVIMEIKDIKHFVVTGANHTVFAYKGEDVILNCSVDSHVLVSEVEEVSWKKTDRDGDMLVLLYQDGEIFPESSHEIYKDRVDFFSSEIPKGNFSLKLMDVRMEDKGEFVCEVHTSHMSTRTSVVLQGVGFSALHIAILVWCSIALLLAVGLCGPVYILLRKRVSDSKEGLKRHIFLIVFPNICMFVTFCLWTTEGFLSEVITCSAVSIMRPVILLKTSTYLSMFPGRLQKAVKSLAVPLYHSVITVTACSIFFKNIARIQITSGYIITVLVVLAAVIVTSAVVLDQGRTTTVLKGQFPPQLGGFFYSNGPLGLEMCTPAMSPGCKIGCALREEKKTTDPFLPAFYGFRIQLAVCLEIFNIILLGIVLTTSNSNFDFSFEITSVIGPQIMGMLMVLCLRRHLFLGKPFKCMQIALPSIIVTIFSLTQICVYILLSITLKDFAKGWILLFEVFMYILAWLGVIYLLRCHRGHREGCCPQWKKIGDLCCTVIATVLFIVIGAMAFNYVNIIMDHKDRPGYLALMPLIHVLAATCLFKHPKYSPDSLHVIIHMFGTVGLSGVNAVALSTELILKAGKGARTIEDLRLIVLPLETVFVSAWLALQIYDAWVRFKDRTTNFENERRTEPENIAEMEVLSAPTTDLRIETQTLQTNQKQD